MSEPPLISVIVPAHNAEATLGATLSALAAQDLEHPYEVIVVDSASTDGTPEIAATFAARDARFCVLHNAGGEPAGSRNLGVAASSAAEIIAFTDADCTADPHWLSAGLAAITDADLVQGRVIPAGPHGPFDRTLSVGHESGLYETANLFLRRSVFEATGGFAPLPGFAENRPFGEDSWLAWRVIRLGVQTAFAPDALVHHAVFPRDAAGYVAEQHRRAYFPTLVREVPELRARFLWHRLFLSRQTAAFDGAALGVATALLTRRRAPLLAALPYLALLPRDPAAARGLLAGDAVGALALLRGSLSARRLVL